MAPPVDCIEQNAHETTALLPSLPKPDGDSRRTPSSARTRCSWPWTHVVALCFLLVLTADIGEYLFLAPRVRLYESVICTDYYRKKDPSVLGDGGSVPEYLCKVDVVQDKVATILGWQLFFDNIPAILLPIPYGYLADKYGRKWFTVLSVFGLTLSWASILFIIGLLHLPIEYVWTSSLLTFIGGGASVATALVITIASDVTPVDKRSSAFFYLFTSELIDECLVPPVTAILMSKSMWIPLLSAVGMLAISTLLALALPETLPIQDFGKSDASGNALSDTDRGDETSFGPVHPKRNSWKDVLGQSKKAFAFATRNTTVAALILTFLVSKVGRQSLNLLLQYVSKRYDWSLSKAGLLMSLRAAVNILLFVIVLPFIATFAIFKKNKTSGDLWIARGSVVLMIVGAGFLATSATPALMIVGLVLYTLGMGFVPVLRSLVTTLVEAQQEGETSDIGRLNAIISLMEGAGNLIAGPGMAWMFRIGMGLGKSWLGLPFAFAAALFVLVAPIVFVINI